MKSRNKQTFKKNGEQNNQEKNYKKNGQKNLITIFDVESIGQAQHQQLYSGFLNPN